MIKKTHALFVLFSSLYQSIFTISNFVIMFTIFKFQIFHLKIVFFIYSVTFYDIFLYSFSAIF